MTNLFNIFERKLTIAAATALGLLAAPAFATCVTGDCGGSGSSSNDKPTFTGDWELSPDQTGGGRAIGHGIFYGSAGSGADGEGDEETSSAFTFVDGSTTTGAEFDNSTDPNCGPDCGEQTWRVFGSGIGTSAAGATNETASEGGNPAFSMSDAAAGSKFELGVGVQADVN